MTRLKATFQPQEWIHDHAIDSAPSFEFDAAPSLLSLTLDQLRYANENVHKSAGRDLDLVAEGAGLIGSGKEQHDGPYRVDVDEDEFDAFLSEIGAADLSTMTAEAWTEIAERARLPSAPTP